MKIFKNLNCHFYSSRLFKLYPMNNSNFVTIMNNKNLLRIQNKFSYQFPKFHFCEELPSSKIKEVKGLLSPILKSNRNKNNKQSASPKEELFYGVPFTKEVPKSREDLIKKFEYINNFDEMLELFINCENQFRGYELSLFLERLNM